MTGFEPGSSGIGSDRSANCATTTAQKCRFVLSATNVKKAMGLHEAPTLCCAPFKKVAGRATSEHRCAVDLFVIDVNLWACYIRNSQLVPFHCNYFIDMLIKNSD